MLNFDINEYKIPVISGINDNPIPPNFEGKGKGCNGAFLTEKLNNFVDLVGAYKNQETIDGAIASDYKIPVVSGINDNPTPPNSGSNGSGCNGAFYTQRFNSLVDLFINHRDNISELNLDINDYKIAIFPGLNDSPIPPDFRGNGKGCNGSFYVEKINKLADLLITYIDLPTLENLSIDGSLDPVFVEVGYNIEEPINFSFIINNPNNFEVESDLYYGLDEINLNLTLQDLTTSFEHKAAVSKYKEETTTYWTILSKVDKIFTIQSNFLEISWRKPYILGKSTADTVLTNTDSSFNLISKSLNKEDTFIVDLLEENNFLYLFTPVDISGIRLIDGGTVIPTEKSTDITIYTGLPPNSYEGYYLHRTVDATTGNFSFEIIT